MGWAPVRQVVIVKNTIILSWYVTRDYFGLESWKRFFIRTVSIRTLSKLDFGTVCKLITI